MNIKNWKNIIKLLFKWVNKIIITIKIIKKIINKKL